MACLRTKSKTKKQTVFKNTDLVIPATLEELLESIQGANHTYDALKNRKEEFLAHDAWQSSFNIDIKRMQLKKKVTNYLTQMLDQQRRLALAVHALAQLNKEMVRPQMGGGGEDL